MEQQVDENDRIGVVPYTSTAMTLRISTMAYWILRSEEEDLVGSRGLFLVQQVR